MWHTLTNHPAHQKPGEDGAAPTDKKTDEKKDESKKDS